MNRNQLRDLYCLEDSELLLFDCFGVSDCREATQDRHGWTDDKYDAVKASLIKKTGLLARDIQRLARWITAKEGDVQKIHDFWCCPACSLLVPAEQVPFFPFDKRCEACIKKAVDRQLVTERIRKSQQALESILKHCGGRREGPDISYVTLICNEVVRLDGGWQEFARHWHSQIEQAREIAPGRKATMDAHRDLVTLMLALRKQEEQSRRHDDMTDEELMKYASQLVVGRLTKQLEDNILADALTLAQEPDTIPARRIQIASPGASFPEQGDNQHGTTGPVGAAAR